jgi:hypothetical protein
MSASLPATSAARAAGAVAPQARLMFAPSGRSKWAVTLAPLAPRMTGATTLAEPLAQSTRRRRSEPMARAISSR